MDATLVVTVADLDQLTLALKAVSAHVEVLTLTIQPQRVITHEYLYRPAHYELTLIEWQMIELAVRGAARRHIAAQLSLAPSSISTYWARIYDKLGFRSRAEVIAWYRSEVIRRDGDAVEVAALPSGME